jgi:hypothetical protein
MAMWRAAMIQSLVSGGGTALKIKEWACACLQQAHFF